MLKKNTQNTDDIAIPAYLSNLNAEQKEAVFCIDGPSLVFAGAGTGKTKVIVSRIAHILEKGICEPENILAVTFTNKAAREMKERVAALMGDSKEFPEISTFHSFCLRILRKHAGALGYEDFSVIDDADAKKIITGVINELNVDKDVYDALKAKQYIESRKHKYIFPEKAISEAETPIEKTYALIYDVYSKKLKESGLMDFGDLILNALRLFEKYPLILERYSNFYKYILVDEYQDTDYPQNKLIEMLAKKHNNICVVGDDDQSIYGFRGANIKNILNFKNKFKGCRIIKLHENYRSTTNILKAGTAVIKNNKEREEKALSPNRINGELIELRKFADDDEEGDFIAEKIKELTADGYSLNDIAVLYRINSISRMLENSLVSAGIDYKIYGGLEFYGRKEIKDILSFIRFAVNSKDLISFDRSVSCVPIGAGDAMINKIKTVAEKNKTDIISALRTGKLNCIKSIEKSNENDLFGFQKIEQKEKRNISDYFDLILEIKEKIDSCPAGEIIKEIYEKSGYKELILKDKCGESRKENIEKLIEIVSGYENIKDFLDECALDGAEEEENDDPKVSLMSIHKSKGLEFPVVFLVGMEEGIFPHAKCMDDIEEERRLCYVGITRAKDKLYLTFAENRNIGTGIKGNDISRFVKEIPKNNFAIYL
ncbi:MAG: ATP-dependent helicase [bacterium]|jgi:DNA helicase-2/ATP-dependent DNA helicase PcrA